MQHILVGIFIAMASGFICASIPFVIFDSDEYDYRQSLIGITCYVIGIITCVIVFIGKIIPY
jgi:hypothetical protein